ncbi:MAG: LytTR family transcriptional regulator [Clostridia bacterium]|nr:LytTR family transcriptional regulator [Clostridia bacterium]
MSVKLDTLSMEIVRNYYEGDCSLFFEYLYSDVVILSVGKGQLMRGKAAVMEGFSGKMQNGIVYDLIALSSESYPLKRDSCNVLIQMDLVSYFPNGMITRVNQRISVDWRYEKEEIKECGKVSSGWKMHFIHISVALQTKEKPLNINHLSEQLLYETTGMYQSETKEVFRDTTGKSHYISTSQLVRIEANRAYSYLILRDEKSIKVAKNITAIEKEYKLNFIRTHSSHLVNPYYIMELKNYRVVLIDGTVLPVSRTRFKEAKMQLDDQRCGTGPIQTAQIEHIQGGF